MSVDLSELMQTCVVAALEAGAVIRRIRAGGQLNAELKIDGDPKSVLTEADLKAQECILAHLARYPGLPMVCEEDVGADQRPVQKGEGVTDMPAVICESMDFFERVRGLHGEVPLKDVCVFVDPVDGTREFVEGRLSAVQTLIGISLKGISVAGVVGLPFWGDGEVMFGAPGVGVVGVPPTTEDQHHHLVLATSAQISDSTLVGVRHVLAADEVRASGGCGNKYVPLLQGVADVAMMNLGTSLWDTCAPEALLRALGGTTTDLLGCPFDYRPSGRVPNMYGVLATAASLPRVSSGRTHASIVADICRSGVLYRILPPRTKAIASPQAEALGEEVGVSGFEGGAVEVARRVDGTLLTSAWLSEQVGAAVVSYSAPEKSAFRYLQSDGVRLCLKYHDSVTNAGQPDGPPTSVFYKRVVMRELEHARSKSRHTPEKLDRDAKSFAVEAGFLGSEACRYVQRAGVRIPRVYNATLPPTSATGIDCHFSLMLEDLSPECGYRQEHFLGTEELSASLYTLAKMHACFWNKGHFMTDPVFSDARRELLAAVWHEGGYWSLNKQPSGQLDDLETEWQFFVERFKETMPMDDCSELGQRLKRCARKLANQVHIGRSHEHSTLIHGDAKLPNLFFKEQDGGLQCALIDFQWCGWGLGAMDIAYLVAAGAHSDELCHNGDKEDAILRRYYSYLCEELVKHGVANTVEDAEKHFSFTTLKRQYEYCILDLLRIIVSYQWARIKASPAVIAARAANPACNAYTRSLDHVRWLVSRGTALLNDHGDPAAL